MFDNGILVRYKENEIGVLTILDNLIFKYFKINIFLAKYSIFKF